MDLGTMIFLLAVAGLLVAAAKYRQLVLEVRLLRGQLVTAQAMQATVEATPELINDIATVPHAGRALANPPGDLRTALDFIHTHYKSPYTFPLGWHRNRADRAALISASFIGDVNHILITGQSDAGKDNLAMSILLGLAGQYSPHQVQVCIIDGKGLDWAGWESKQHCWRIALDPEQIGDTMKALTGERQRRRVILQHAKVAKWDEYEGADLPLLVVYVSELLLLQNATSKSELTSWLNAELTAARAFGIRYVIATQTASNFDTQWRSQISLFLAGFQPAQSQDTPNTGLTTSELEALGGVPPSKLPNPPSGAGVFCAVQGRDVEMIRASYLSSSHRQWLLDQLHNRANQDKLATSLPRGEPLVPTIEQPQKGLHPLTNGGSDLDLLEALFQAGDPLPFDDARVAGPTRGVERSTNSPTGHHSELNHTLVEHAVGPVEPRRTSADSASSDALRTRPTTFVELPLPEDVVPFDEQRRIIEAAQGVKSKRQLSLKLYDTDGGQKYTWVRQVCDAIGVL